MFKLYLLIVAAVALASQAVASRGRRPVIPERYLVLLKNNGAYYCSGALTTPGNFLTSGVCSLPLWRQNNWIAVVGTNHMRTVGPEHRVLQCASSKFEGDESNPEYQFALCSLRPTIDGTQYVDYQPVAASYPVIGGSGTVLLGPGDDTGPIQRLDVNIWPHIECQNRLRTSGRYGSEIRERMICASHGEGWRVSAQSLQVEKGAPLIRDGSTIGNAVSIFYESGMPAVFMNVEWYVRWFRPRY